MQKIAVIGTGIAGMAAAWLLHRDYDITVYEKNDYVGGHSHTVDVDYQGVRIPVDTGFIVFNHRTYPNVTALFALLGVMTQKSEMSFGVTADAGALEYAGRNLGSLFAQKRNLLNPAYLRMLRDIVHFNRRAPLLLDYPGLGLTLGDYLDELGMGRYFRLYYLLPMAAAIWSCPVNIMMRYPAESFVRFFHNHGLLTIRDQPQWYTVSGGSREYVARLTAPFKDRLRLNTAASCITRAGGKVTVEDERGHTEIFDHAVLATHGDQACRILKDKTVQEQEILSRFRYTKNRAVLHRDPGLMPRRRAAWASWVYQMQGGEAGAQASLTYWMNRLQSIDETKPLFVSLNPLPEPREELTFGEFIYEHPIFDEAAMQAQAGLTSLQGRQNTWFCGSYHRYGFHEDALLSAMQVAEGLGVKIPWI